jgi:hypothetical protein
MLAKQSVRLWVLLLVPLAASLAVRAQSVDEIIAKNIQAHGGTDKLKSVQTRRISAELNVGSYRVQFVQENKRPDKVREEDTIQGFTQVQAYDGRTSWQVDPTQGRKEAQLLSGDDSKGLIVDADMDGPLVDYQRKGNTAELMGHDSVEGTDCYKIKLTLKNGDIRYYYLDADSFLELKLETQTFIRGSVQESETYFGDYEQVNGIYYPFALEQGQKGDPNRIKFTVQKIDVNVPLDDARFALPAAKPPAKASSNGQ